MNTSFNYSGFIEMFLESNDEFESYGVITEGLEQLEPDANSVNAEKYVISKAVLPTLD
ncbi:MAG: hypothetical protein HKM94_02270 [Halobacteria archaeon]|nr:hypothetical protein [Halobacteria archaeon]